LKDATHIIEKVVVEINTGSRESAEAIKDNIGRFMERELFPRLEKLLDRYDHSGGTVRFNSLNLEIAALRFDTVKSWEPEITRRLAEKLEFSVGTVNGKKAAVFDEGRGESIAPPQNREDTFLFFLGNGYLPWFGRKEYINELTTLSNWKKSLAGNDFTDRLVKVLQKKPAAVDRLILQFDPEITARFLASAEPGFGELLKEVTAFTEKQSYQFRRLFLKFLLLIFTGDNTKFLLQTVKDLAGEVYTSKSPVSDKAGKTAVSEVKAIIRKAVDIQLKTKPERKDELSVFLNLVRFPGHGEPEPPDLKPGLKKGRVEKKRMKEGSVSENDSNEREEPEAILAQESADEDSAFFEKDEGEIAVTNAGLVLLHPFLKPFFKTVKITDKHGNILKARRHLAVQMVHYLATGKDDFFESDLVFSKFLCGVPLETPVSRASLLTEAGKNEANQLLKEVIKHWSALKNTSPDGLRQMFLQRNGKLFKKERNYRLVVERKAQDILLEKLAWNISMVKIPWLKELLYVDW
jgi:hypothetical protein